MPSDPDRVREVQPVYGAYYYDRLIGDHDVSGDYEYEGDWRKLFEHFAHHLIEKFDPKNIFDAGCAKGFLVRALRDRGIEATGLDASEYAISQAASEISDYVRVGSITEPLGGPYDLITCIEVIEHVPESEVDEAVARLCQATDRIVFSSTPDDFAEPSHLSVKPTEDWVALFARQGFYRNFQADMTFLTPWAILFERRPASTLADTVREYDRVFVRQQREIAELRKVVLNFSAELDAGYQPETDRVELQNRFDGLIILHNELQAQLADLAHERDGLKRQLGVMGVELLRLRDLLIGRERELGGVAGRIAELESELKQFGKLTERYRSVVNSTTWRVSWKVFAPLRKLQARRAEGSDGRADHD